MKKFTLLLVSFSAVVALLTYGFNFPFVENSTGFNTVKTQNPSNNTDVVSKKLSEGLKYLTPQSPNLVNAYTWSQSTGTYTSISGTGTLIGSGLRFSEVFANQPIGFSFQFDGPAFTTFGVSANGFITFDAITQTYNWNPLSTGTENRIISAISGRRVGGNAAGNGIYRQTTGTAPNRVLTVEWKNWGYSFAYNAEINAQIKLYETTNVIEIIYGPSAISTPGTHEVGLRGSSISDFNNRTTTTDWTATTAGSANTATCSISGSVYPANGLTWTWTPWAFPPISYVSSTTTQNSNVVSINSVNNQVIGMQVVTTGYTPGLTISQFNLSTTGSTNPLTDIRNAKIFYTGTSSTFSTSTQFGTTVTNPNGAFNVAGTQVLPTGTNYFWLTYDVPITATQNNIIDATCESITGSGSMGTVIPVPTAPGGGREIFGAMSGNYIVGLGQTTPNFPTLTDAISNLSIRGVNGPVTLLVKPGVYGTDAGLEVDSMFTIPTITGASAVNTVTIKRKSDEAGMVWFERRGTSAGSEYIFRLNGANYITFDSINVRQKDSTLHKDVEYGFYITPSSSTVGSQNNTVRNCSINLTMTSGKSGIYQYMTITPTAPSGTNSFNKFYNNNISSVFNGIYIYGNIGAAYPYNLYDQDVRVGVEGGNNITNWGGGYLPTGIYVAYQRGLAVANNTIIQSSNASTEVYGINLITGTNSNVDVYNNTITFTAASPTSNVYGINNTMGGTPLGNHVNIYNNRLINWTLSSFTSGVCYMIYNASSANADSVNIYNNTISDVTVGGTGTLYGIWQEATANNINIYGDTLRNISKTGSGTVYGIYNNGASTSIGTEKIYNNVISNVGSTSTSTLNLMRISSAPINRYVYGNIINNCSTGGATVNGIYQSTGTNNFIYNNKIDNLTSSNAASTVYGIYNNSGTFAYIYNNFVSNLNTPASNTQTSAYGLYINAPVTYLGAFNNSIYLNSTSYAPSFGNIGVYIGSSASNTIELRNNNIVNNSTPGATGRTAGIRYSSTTYTNYHSGSGANNIYMGLGVPNYLRSYFYDGTNSDSTLLGFQNRVTPREQSSVSENPAFVNAAAGDLHIAGASLLKQGGYAVTSVPVGPAFSFTTDIDGATRNATFFDIGADEFTGTRIAGTAPRILYTQLGKGNTSNRTLNNVVIQDPEGVDNTNKPRVYFKKLVDANTFIDNTKDTDGWKYTVTSSPGSPYSFTIDYSIIYGGTVTLSDTIVYFVVAQDLAGTPNVGINAGAFTSMPTSVDLTAAEFPITGNVNRYAIAGSFSSEINVGAGETYTSLTGAAPTGLFAAINSGELAGNLTINITTDLSETGTTELNKWNEQKAAAGYSLTIKAPDTATYVRTISGWVVGNSLIRLNGPSGVTFDGGAGKFLRFRQMTIGQPAFLLKNGTQNTTIKNCNIEGNNNSTTVGIISLTTANTLLSLGNSYITIDNNNISARSDTIGPPVLKIGISSTGTNTPGLLNSNNTITNNNIFNFELDGIYMTTGNGDGWVIKKNSFYYNHATPMTTGTTGWTAVFFNAGINSNGNTIDSNFIGGSAPLCAGTPTDLLLIDLQCMYLNAGHNIQSTIRGNIIRNIRSRWMMSNTTTNYAIRGEGGWIDISGNYIGSADTAQRIEANHNFRAITFTSTLINSNVPKPITCNNNIINNITSRSDTIMPSAVTRVGINIGGNADADVIGNTISNFDYKVNPCNKSNNFTLIGILPNSNGVNVVKNNTILNMGYSSNQERTSTGLQYCYGIQPNTVGNGSIISENKITNLYINGPGKISSGNGDNIHGISNLGSYAGTSMTISNNQITILGNSSDSTLVYGISDRSSTANINTYAYNTVLIGGTVNTPYFISAGFWKSSTSCVSTLRNNIFYNGRTGGAAGHIAIGTANNTLLKGNTPVPEPIVVYAEDENISKYNGTSPMGPISPKFDSDYNLFAAPSNSQLTAWYTIYKDFASWKTSSGGDMNSYADTTANIPAETFFKNLSEGNLNIDTANSKCWSVYKKGIPLALFPQDYNGLPRSTSTSNGSTCIGSHEFTTSTTTPPSATPSAAPAASTTTTYALAGRNIASITWGAGGTVPSNIELLYYSGTNPPNSTGFNIGNCYWRINPTGGTGFTYDITFYYDEAQLGTITSEDKIRLIKSEDGVSYTIYLTQGTGPGQYQIDMTNNTITVYGLTSFSYFGLNDADTPLPVELASFTAISNRRDVNLKWKTGFEYNNKGFEIERKAVNTESWSKLGYIEGKNIATGSEYKFEDRKLESGKYNYRLKQIDFNGNYEYFNLSGAIEVGIPTKYNMSQNYPNPFNPTTKIDFDLPLDSRVSIIMYDISGREVKTLLNEQKTAGYYTIQFNSAGLSSGTYFYRIITKSSGADFIMTKKMVLIK